MAEGIAHGTTVSAPGATKLQKVYDCQRIIGASDGNDSQWLYVERSSGTDHGYPITEREFREAIRGAHDDA